MYRLALLEFLNRLPSYSFRELTDAVFRQCPPPACHLWPLPGPPAFLAAVRLVAFCPWDGLSYWSGPGLAPHRLSPLQGGRAARREMGLLGACSHGRPSKRASDLPLSSWRRAAQGSGGAQPGMTEPSQTCCCGDGRRALVPSLQGRGGGSIVWLLFL